LERAILEVGKMPNRYAYTREKCLCCETMGWVRFPEEGIPTLGDPYYANCPNCGSTFYFMAGAVVIPETPEENREAVLAKKYRP
jgi:hypothetical protein